ncbi:MAG: hypothetical protein U0744_02790 [Gemmataceae bacterium]
MDMGFFAAFGAMIFVILAVVVVVGVFYCLTLFKAMEKVSPRNRLMASGLVWLAMIPYFNIVWAFFNAINVPGSLRNEFRDRGMDDGSDYGKNLGLIGAGLSAASTVIGLLANLFTVGAVQGQFGAPQVGGGAMILGLLSSAMSLGWFVIFIIFWVKIAGYSSRLSMGGSALSDRGYDDRDFDDAPRRDRGPADGGPSDAYRQDDRNRIR